MAEMLINNLLMDQAELALAWDLIGSLGLMSNVGWKQR